ncbi:dihydrofolate reductase family protein [Nonomuraea muscovyensis]|uniref:Dihydrofolate reductase n=1 Tax=Nonomuraea muscovyensis TaxID=1124761 RepID=A0A7X0BWZ8_9ACTN|nr:dihydrofolate reductase family protein [Nonomuraea muscovyensis]MBB6344380.1 dihydrofolate reductase [Nonomuraea muscovyensis]
MRKIVAGLFVSLDGVVESPETWHFPYLNEEMGAAVMAIQAEADTLLLGRATYESFAAVWPHQTGEMADRLNNIRKLVVSSTMRTAEWNNSTVISGDVIDELERIKKLPGKNISVTGSITLTRALLRAGLIDELHLMVHPIVLGAGTRLFDESTGRLPLKLVDSTTFRSGVLNLHYQPA